jgi:hypothetical protein
MNYIAYVRNNSAALHAKASVLPAEPVMPDLQTVLLTDQQRQRYLCFPLSVTKPAAPSLHFSFKLKTRRPADCTTPLPLPLIARPPRLLHASQAPLLLPIPSCCRCCLCLCLWSYYCHMQLLQLLPCNLRWCLCQQALRLRGLREGNYIPNRPCTCQQHSQPVQAKCNPAMWWRSQIKAVQQVPKLSICFLRGQAYRVKDLLLDVAPATTAPRV